MIAAVLSASLVTTVAAQGPPAHPDAARCDRLTFITEERRIPHQQPPAGTAP